MVVFFLSLINSLLMFFTGLLKFFFLFSFVFFFFFSFSNFHLLKVIFKC